MNILTSAGYDSALSIADLNESDIIVIQDHVSNKARHLVKEHKSYANNEKFEFLPGHRKLVLGLRKRVNDFNTNNKGKKAKEQTPISIQGETEVVQTTEEIELLTTEEIVNLKKDLIVKLNKVAQSIGSPEFTEEHSIGTLDGYISKNSRAIASKTLSYKCSVKCAVCNKSVPCTFNKRWETSNILQHLKSHKSELNLQKELDQDLVDILEK